MLLALYKSDLPTKLAQHDFPTKSAQRDLPTKTRWFTNVTKYLWNPFQKLKFIILRLHHSLKFLNNPDAAFRSTEFTVSSQISYLNCLAVNWVDIFAWFTNGRKIVDYYYVLLVYLVECVVMNRKGNHHFNISDNCMCIKRMVYECFLLLTFHFHYEEWFTNGGIHD